MTLGSKSTKMALGTCFPELVSEKKVLKESSPPPSEKSLGIWPSGWMACSKQYNSQQELPIWTPACPTWMEMTSRMIKEWRKLQEKRCVSNLLNANWKRIYLKGISSLTWWLNLKSSTASSFVIELEYQLSDDLGASYLAAHELPYGKSMLCKLHLYALIGIETMPRTTHAHGQLLQKS